MKQLTSYVVSMSRWRNEYGPPNGLSKQTFDAMLTSNKALPDLINYRLNTKNLEYIILGNIQSDYLEKRFIWYRQLEGENYFVSVLQLLQAEKSRRIRSLVSMNFDMSAIKEIFRTEKPIEMNKSKNDVSFLMEEVSTSQLEDSILTSHRDEAILYYIAGYIARSLMKSTVCQDCSWKSRCATCF